MAVESGDIRVVHAQPRLALALANGVRRQLLTTGSVAPGAVHVRRNDSVMTDEQLAHRLGMLVFPNDRFGAERLELRMRSEPTRTRCVFACDILRAGGEPALPGDMTPIVLLGPGAGLDLTLALRHGTGAEHARFCPVQVAWLVPRDGECAVAYQTTGALGADATRRQALRELRARVLAARAEVASAPTAPGPPPA